jgi:hypothetical protein
MCWTFGDDLAGLADLAGLKDPVTREAWISAAKEVFARYQSSPPPTAARMFLSNIESRLDTIEKLLRNDPSTWRF